MSRKKLFLSTILLIVVACALWIARDLTDRTRHDLRAFDGHEVGRLETAMWRSYYGQQRLRLFSQLVELQRHQYHLPFWRSCLGAYDAARAAVVFQAGHGRKEYMKALPDLERFYSLIRQNSSTRFDVKKAAALELEWWIIHRERARHSPGDLVRALAGLQSQIYLQPEGRFEEHARTRADAMLLRDSRAAAGMVSEQDWTRIGTLLDRSWVSLQSAAK